LLRVLVRSRTALWVLMAAVAGGGDEALTAFGSWLW